MLPLAPPPSPPPPPPRVSLSPGTSFFLLKQFEDVNIYLNSIKAYMYNDDDFNWNHGISLAQTGNFKVRRGRPGGGITHPKAPIGTKAFPHGASQFVQSDPTRSAPRPAPRPDPTRPQPDPTRPAK